MDRPRQVFRAFDAFPKIAPSNQVRSTRGSLTSILMYVFLFFMIWVEVGGYLDGFIDHQYTVDDVIRKDLLLNVDLAVAMPCQYLQANVRDATQDRLLAAEKLNFEGIMDNVPSWFFHKQKKVQSTDLEDILSNSMEARFTQEGQHTNLELPYCRIYGSIPINRVKGDFHITAKGYGYLDRERAPEEALNFTHYISELSFGVFYPYFDNPLDMTYKVTDERRHSFHYKLDVVATLYTKLGMEVDSTQYSMSMFEAASRYMPGIFIRYDFEPIKMIVAERRLSFWHFLIRLVTIIGGIWIMAKWVYKLGEKVIILVWGKEVANRDKEEKKGLLDELEIERI